MGLMVTQSVQAVLILICQMVALRCQMMTLGCQLMTERLAHNYESLQDAHIASLTAI